MASRLKVFLNDSKNSLSRESTLRYRFCFDMKLAAAKRGYDLKVMYGDVDNEGADIVLDDGDVLRRIQLKSIFDAKTSFWKIHTSLLRPEPAEFDDLDFISEGPFGKGGAVVLQVLKETGGEIKVSYEFSDVYLLKALDWNIVRRRPATQGQVVEAAIGSLQRAVRSNAKIKLSRSLFIKAKSADHLLGLLGLHSDKWDGIPYRYQICEFGKRKLYPQTFDDPTRAHKEMLAYGRLVNECITSLADNVK